MKGIEEALEGIARGLRSMLSGPQDDRIMIFKRIDPFFLRLEGELKRSPNAFAHEKLQELRLHAIIIARLDDPDGHSDDQHCSWAMGAIDALRGPRGFGAAPGRSQ